MKEYLEKTSPHNISFYSWHAFSKLNFLESSGIWMKNLSEIVKIKKGLTIFEKRLINDKILNEAIK